MLFKNFRQRLLFWFLIFISSNVIVISFVLVYLEQRNSIELTSHRIDQAHIHFLKYLKSQQDFFGFDTKNEEFYATGQSANRDSCRIYFDSTLWSLNEAIASNNDRFSFDKELDEFQSEFNDLDSVFEHMIGLIVIHGFKDQNVIGEIRDDAHWLENAPEVNKEQLLMLRRHEKDYQLRNDLLYVQRFNYLLEEFANGIGRNRSIGAERKSDIITKVYSYQRHFNELVDLDQLIGLNSNKGLKQSIDKKAANLESLFNSITEKTETQKRILFYNLNRIYIILVILLFIISLFVSYFIANRITAPLRNLNFFISRFVESDFQLQENNPIVKTKDEIGRLTKNFSIMKNEVVSSIETLNQKVEERTQELAIANTKLIKINEANSRFVPKEFLNFLDKQSVEEIQLGDQIEKNMTVMFTDIRSFTQISEALSPQENFDFINSYLNELVPIITKYGGFIDKYIGDSIMSLFPEDPDKALTASKEFKYAIEHFNQSLREQGKDPIRIGCGIHTGHLILGTVGTEKRLDTTVISDAVNISSRIEGLTKHYGVGTIFTDECLISLRNKADHKYRFLDYVKVKGKSYPISIYELIHPDDSDKISSIEEYEEGIKLYFTREFEAACDHFSKLLIKHPDDQTIQIFQKRCADLHNEGVSEDWNGVQVITFK